MTRQSGKALAGHVQAPGTPWASSSFDGRFKGAFAPFGRRNRLQYSRPIGMVALGSSGANGRPIALVSACCEGRRHLYRSAAVGSIRS